MRFDLQSHSTYSDGELRPGGVVAAGAAAGVELLALTDHDSVDGVGEAVEAARAAGIEVVPAVEISSSMPPYGDLHILGYQLDVAHPELLRALELARAARESRSEEIASALHELGFELDDELLATRAAAGLSIGRPHLAQAVVAHPANAPRLGAEGLPDASAFLEAYLVEGRPAFRVREAMAAADAIELIHTAGGVAVWAHPFWAIATPEEVLAALDRLRAAGLDGVEAFYITHTAAQTRLLVRRCEELGLLSTGSSDFHGPAHPLLSRFLAFDLHGCAPSLGPIAPAGA